MSYKSGCMVCGEELVYSEIHVPASCFYCGTAHETNARCVNGHYVCDDCHGGSAKDLIERYCIHADSKAPLAMATTLMKYPVVKMHGPEHHFLVPAVLLAAYCNRLKVPSEEKGEKIRLARKRAEDIKGGFCGFHGACGAAIGAGIFISIVANATPLSGAEWKLCNLVTARCLQVIAMQGGPRCCKRDSFLAITTAAEFLRDEFGVSLDIDQPVQCTFSNLNGECLFEECLYYYHGGE
jgi:hypothetical protein